MAVALHQAAFHNGYSSDHRQSGFPTPRFHEDTIENELVRMIGNYFDVVLKVTTANKRRLSADHVSSLMKNRLHPLKYQAVVLH